MSEENGPAETTTGAAAEPMYSFTSEEARAAYQRFKRSMEPPTPAEYAHLRAMADRGEIPRRTMKAPAPASTVEEITIVLNSNRSGLRVVNDPRTSARLVPPEG